MHLNPGDVLMEAVLVLSSSSDVGEAVMSFPEKHQSHGLRPGMFECGDVFQKNKKVMKRMKSEGWNHFSLPVSRQRADTAVVSSVWERRVMWEEAV